MISESARQEWNELEEKFEEIHKEVKQVIEDVEKLERLEKDSRYKLMIVSKNFRKYSEEDIRQAYDTTRDLQIKLALMREKNSSLLRKEPKLK